MNCKKKRLNRMKTIKTTLKTALDSMAFLARVPEFTYPSDCTDFLYMFISWHTCTGLHGKLHGQLHGHYMLK